MAVAPRRRILLQGCNPRARGSLRGPFRGKSFELPRRKARGDGGDPRRARPVSGAPDVEGTARGSGRAAARGPVFRELRRPCAAGSIWSQARACQGILELCEWFRDCSQASGASQRVQRASAPRPTGLRCGWPCTAWPTARPQPGCCFAGSTRTCLVARVESLASAVCTRPGVACSQCAARRAWPAGALRDGVDSLCADRRRCAPSERGVVGSGGARACSRERAGARAPPTHLLHCARTCCSQRGSVRGARAATPTCFGCGCARVSRRSVARSVALRVARVSPLNRGAARGSAGYLVDPASSHMLVSKIKPCMSKYKRLVL